MKRVDYQNPHNNLEEVNEKRNAEIRAYGQRVLAEADAAQRGDVTTIDDWDVLDVEADIEPPAPTEPQPVVEPVTEPEEDEQESNEVQTEPNTEAEAVTEKKETAAQKKKREAEEAKAEVPSKEA
jgi:hypothetical protein